MATTDNGRRLNGNGRPRPPRAAPDTQEGCWSREQLVRMDAKFVAAMERAIKRGLERSTPLSEPPAV
jgi:hypothetical protein